MIRLLADEHIDAAVVAGLFRRRPEIEFLRVQSIGLRMIMGTFYFSATPSLIRQKVECPN